MKIDAYRLATQLATDAHAYKATHAELQSQHLPLISQQGLERGTQTTTEYTYTARELAAQQQSLNSDSRISGSNGQLFLNQEYELSHFLSNMVSEQVSVRQINVRPIGMANQITQRPTGINHQSAGQQADFTLQSYFLEYQQSSLQFQAHGQVSLADGRMIDFNLSLNMDQAHFKHENLQLSQHTQPLRYDPLLLDLSGQGPQLSTVSFDFDMNLDGQNETLAFAGAGSGFLVLDKNQDGEINNGSELLGGLTGEAFKELAHYDDDGNGWIDENDAVFERLQVWHLDSHGQKVLTQLADAGVGALYLGNEAAQYTLKDQHNQELGIIQRSGVYLREDGLAASMVQVDLADRSAVTSSGQATIFNPTDSLLTRLEKESIAHFSEWLNDEQTLGQLNQMIDAVNALNLSKMAAEPDWMASSDNNGESPMLAALRESMLRLQQSLADMKAQSEDVAEPVDLKFDHMLSLVKMIDGLAKKKDS